MISIHSQFSDMKYNLPIFHRFSQKCQIIVLAPFFQLNGGPNQRLNIPGKWNININNGFISNYGNRQTTNTAKHGFNTINPSD